jgi:hypothetical protein
MRPTGLASPVDKDRQNFTIYSGDWAMGRRPPPATIEKHRAAEERESPGQIRRPARDLK